jgi:hypothetical protein
MGQWHCTQIRLHIPGTRDRLLRWSGLMDTPMLHFERRPGHCKCGQQGTPSNLFARFDFGIRQQCKVLASAS